MEVSDSSSRILAGLLEARTGQQLTMNRRWRIETALKSLMRERGIESIDQLITVLVAGRDSRLSDLVVEALLNNETFFYRDRAPFDLLLKGALRRFETARAAEKTLNIWCAGCSTGQEAYSIAMALAEDKGRWDGWKIDLVGTDVSQGVIERAREGLYSQFEVQRGLGVMQMMRWFSEEEGQQWRLSDEIRGRVRFKVASILDQPPRPGPYDIILCRNVLLYFADDKRRLAFDRIAEAAAPDACLMLGAGETVIGQTQAFAADPELRGLYMRSVPAAKRVAHG
jgi:chemotaxis protein methyltransferase CheR